MAIVTFQSFTDSSDGGIVETHVMHAEPIHLVESAAIGLHSSMNFGSRN